jgi:hypothetical protein
MTTATGALGAAGAHASPEAEVRAGEAEAGKEEEVEAEVVVLVVVVLRPIARQGLRGARTRRKMRGPSVVEATGVEADRSLEEEPEGRIPRADARDDTRREGVAVEVVKVERRQGLIEASAVFSPREILPEGLASSRLRLRDAAEVDAVVEEERRQGLIEASAVYSPREILPEGLASSRLRLRDAAEVDAVVEEERRQGVVAASARCSTRRRP